MALYEVDGKRPTIDASAFVHPEATIMGDVTIGAGCYIGPGARLRGDWGRIVVGDGSNVQENVVIHVRHDDGAYLGEASHIGHAAIIHNARLARHVFVGIGAIILDYAEIGDDCVIAAGAVVLTGAKVPAGKLVVGVPAKATGDVSEKMREEAWEGTRLYQAIPDWYRRTLRRLD
jgi:carbonic anhydrase/acetyltransferase-like protein (isoleucine patch superfamily)